MGSEWCYWASGAKVNTLVKEVITNTTSFERIASDSAMDLSEPNEALGGSKLAAAFPQQRPATPRPASHRLTVHPRFPYDAGESHGCKLCPANLCKVRSASFDCMLHQQTSFISSQPNEWP